MEKEAFEESAQAAFDSLPEVLQSKIENVQIVIEDVPSRDTLDAMGIRLPATLLGLYEGVPLNKRGTWYGTTPILPDKITLFRRNIERLAHTEAEVRGKIRDVLIHEIAHHYGLNEDEVRRAGY